MRMRSGSTARRSVRRWRKRSSSAGPSGELYTELALQTAPTIRNVEAAPGQSGRRRMDRPCARAVPKRARRPMRGRSPQRRSGEGTRLPPGALHAIALRLGDVELRSNALAALTDVAWSAGDLEQRARLAGRAARARPRVSDPDDCHFAQMTAVHANLALARLAEAARACQQLELLVQGLTPHHRMHAVNCRLYVETSKAAGTSSVSSRRWSNRR